LAAGWGAQVAQEALAHADETFPALALADVQVGLGDAARQRPLIPRAAQVLGPG